MYKIVLDTNVLIAALRSRRGRCHRYAQRPALRGHRAVWDSSA